MAQPRWDEQEVALLLDAYLRIEAGSSQKTVAEELSDTLRLRAVNRGFDIDDQFRNVNGMIMQLSNRVFSQETTLWRLMKSSQQNFPIPLKCVRLFRATWKMVSLLSARIAEQHLPV